MDGKLLTQVRSWNKWWQKGPSAIEVYNLPSFRREEYQRVKNHMDGDMPIVSIVGMRQVGKSTMMRQLIQDKLNAGVDPKRIFYIAFDDPYLRTHIDAQNLYETVVEAYHEITGIHILEETDTIYFFLDEVHRVTNWQSHLKAAIERALPIRFVVSGSSSIGVRHDIKESLLGRHLEVVLWPFSFREYVDVNEADSAFPKEIIQKAQHVYTDFRGHFSLQKVFVHIQEIERMVHAKGVGQVIQKRLRRFILEGGFPRAWQQDDFISRQHVLWEHHVGKVLFEDLLQVAKLRKPKDLAFLFHRIVDFNGTEVRLHELKNDLNVHWATLNKYLEYLNDTFLIFRIDRTRSKRIAVKRRSGNVKFYVVDVALRSALYKYDEDIYTDDQEMGLIAENLVCTALHRWVTGPHREEYVQFYKDKKGEVDFVVKSPQIVLPVEVKWRNQVPTLKSLDTLCADWEIKESVVVTKDFDLSYKNGRLSIPLWLFLLCF